MALTVKALGKEWTTEDLTKLSAAELVKIMEDIDVQRTSLKSQVLAVKAILVDKQKYEKTLGKLTSHFKPAEVAELMALMASHPEKVKAALEEAGKTKSVPPINVKAKAAEVKVAPPPQG